MVMTRRTLFGTLAAGAALPDVAKAIGVERPYAKCDYTRADCVARGMGERGIEVVRFPASHLWMLRMRIVPPFTGWPDPTSTKADIAQVDIGLIDERRMRYCMGVIDSQYSPDAHLNLQFDGGPFILPHNGKAERYTATVYAYNFQGVRLPQPLLSQEFEVRG